MDQILMEEELDILKTMWLDSMEITKNTVKELEIAEGRWETLMIGEEIATEIKLNYKITDSLSYVGYVDWIARDTKTGGIYVIDFKTKKTMNDTEWYDIESQTVIYRHLVKQLFNLDTTGSIIIQISSKPFKKPQLTKSGGMSKADLKTTWDVYKQELIDNGLEPSDYIEMKAKLDGKRHVVVTKLSHNKLEINNIWNNELDKIDLFKSAVGVEASILSPFVCAMCSYKEICKSRMRGFEDLEEIAEDYIWDGDL